MIGEIIKQVVNGLKETKRIVFEFVRNGVAKRFGKTCRSWNTEAGRVNEGIEFENVDGIQIVIVHPCFGIGPVTNEDRVRSTGKQRLRSVQGFKFTLLREPRKVFGPGAQNVAGKRFRTWGFGGGQHDRSVA